MPLSVINECILAITHRRGFV